MISRRTVPEPRKSRYGWVPDIPDYRDRMYGALRALPEKLPTLVDLRCDCTPVENQGELGSCTANALAGALEYLEQKDKVPFMDLSRLFIYYNERALEGTINSDSGAMLRDGIKCLARQGVCSEANWPYNMAAFTKRPPKVCYQEAEKHQILSYARLNTVDEMRACLASGFPFVFGFAVYEGFESAQVAKTGVANLPEAGEKFLGGHAVLAVGYDDAVKRFMIRNSWGTGWGMKGYFTLPYAYLAERNLSDDFWTVRRGELM